MRQDIVFCDLCGTECADGHRHYSCMGLSPVDEFDLCATFKEPDDEGWVDSEPIGGCVMRLRELLESVAA